MSSSIHHVSNAAPTQFGALLRQSCNWSVAWHPAFVDDNDTITQDVDKVTCEACLEATGGDDG